MRVHIVRGACALLVTLLNLTPAAAQDALDPREDPASYFDSMPVHQDDSPVRTLLARTQTECGKIERDCPAGEELLRRLFQGTYRDDLPDFIVHLRKDPATGLLAVDQPLLIFQKRNTPYLMGVEHLGVLVFADEAVPMKARLTTIREREVNPFAGIIGLFGVSGGDTAPVSETSSEETPLRWQRLAGSEERPLFVGAARLAIENDIVCRLTLIPEELEALAFQSITAHISNSRSSGAAFSLGLGATFDTDNTVLEETGGDPYFNGYALTKFYFPGRRPRLDVSPESRARFRRSVGVVLGTNISNDPFDEIIVGLSIGHLVGKAGLVIGGNSVEVPETGDREWRSFFGVDFTF